MAASTSIKRHKERYPREDGDWKKPIVRKRGYVKFTEVRRKEFLRLLREDGKRRMMALQEIGVGKHAYESYLYDHPEFRDEIDQAEMDACEQVEYALFQKALKGDVIAIQVWLYNRKPAEWSDRRQFVVITEDILNAEEAALQKRLAELGSKGSLPPARADTADQGSTAGDNGSGDGRGPTVVEVIASSNTPRG